MKKYFESFILTSNLKTQAKLDFDNGHFYSKFLPQICQVHSGKWHSIIVSYIFYKQFFNDCLNTLI